MCYFPFRLMEQNKWLHGMRQSECLSPGRNGHVMIFLANKCFKVSFGQNKLTNTLDFTNHTLKTHMEVQQSQILIKRPRAKFNIYIYHISYITCSISHIIYHIFFYISYIIHCISYIFYYTVYMKYPMLYIYI